MLSHEFFIKYFSDLHDFSSVELILMSKVSRTLGQRLVDLNKHAQHSAKKVQTPMSTSISLTLMDKATQYQSIVRALQYLSFTQQNISFIVNKLVQFMHNQSYRDTLGCCKTIAIIFEEYIFYTFVVIISLSILNKILQHLKPNMTFTIVQLSWIISLPPEMHKLLELVSNIDVIYLCAHLIFYCQMKYIAIDYHFVRTKHQIEIYEYLIFQHIID